MLTGIHFLLTYTCLYECDHCFLYCSPRASGTFTLAQIRSALNEAVELGTVESIYLEGGEPFLYYPLMTEALRLAKEAGFKTGIVSNAYWATAVEDAALWLQQLKDLGIDDLSLSQDEFHGSDEDDSADRAARAAERLGMDPATLCIEKPTLICAPDDSRSKGAPVVGGGALFKGRAADKLTEGFPGRAIETFVTCPHEELIAPERVHIDALGYVHICQGISMGNMWEIPLARLVTDYDPQNHPITGPLVAGGPKRLADAYSVQIGGEFVDECHYCFNVRRALRSTFPEYLGPGLVYGEEE